ncbi:MAG TPA: 5-formyltetrahydrofolate cyclo-ligase [Streptosporangiaceae bacterium]|nr:5-formyltetrahydrofolate cyclo-ligase [Streptosporangiaceae bacterium]
MCADQAGREGHRPGLATEKAALRTRLLAARAGLTAAERKSAAVALRDAVLALPQVQMAGTVAAYYSFGSEPDTHGLVFALWKRGTYVLLPLMRPDLDLDWASYEGPDSLRAGPKGFAEPVEPPRGPQAVARADLVVVPALAVDRQGVRLGRGGGSYDRALARVGSQVPTLALLYDGELLDELPSEPHDQRVRLVAQPSQRITSLPLP